MVEEDACTFVLPERAAHVVTFSYALSMIPNFFSAVDQAMSYLHDDGLLGSCDFYVSVKWGCYRLVWSESELSVGMMCRGVRWGGLDDSSGRWCLTWMESSLGLRGGSISNTGSRQSGKRMAMDQFLMFRS